MLKKIRRITAIVCFALITLLFLDISGALHKWLGWLVKVQLIPAILAVNVTVLIALVLLTFIFGRIYCSVICPLGIMQDFISYFSGKRKGKKNRFRYSSAISWLRYGVIALFIVTLIIGISIIVSLLDPYAAYGRIASSFLRPLYGLGNNVLAWFAERANSYAFYPTEVFIKSWIILGVAILTLLVTGILAWRNGRTYCNTICPVGTFLGFISRYSILRVGFNKDKCTQCQLCERNCKASCIDVKTMYIDHSRCVACFNCVDKCKFGAMEYKPHKIAGGSAVPAKENNKVNMDSKDGISRRAFVTVAGLFAFIHTVKAQQLQVDGGLAEIEDKKVPDRATPIVPPGAVSAKNIKQHCTACQLCISVCPNNILQPSAKLSTFMQPEITYEKGYCRPECTDCSQVCPTGAIKRITTSEKTGIAIGKAIWIKDNCVVNTDKVSCTGCQRNCPTGAIILVAIDADDPKSLKIPVVNTEICIGCGACEYICPARPFSAIYVEGNVVHHLYGL